MILKGYKKQGSTFIPPIMQNGLMKEVSYINDLLPNLVWFGLIFQKFGVKNGVNLIREVVLLANQFGNSDMNFNYLCNFNKLTNFQTEKILKQLESINKLRPVQESLAPITCLFDSSPIQFLLPDFEIDKIELQTQLKLVMKECLDRHSVMSTRIQVTAVYNQIANKKMLLSSHINLPDFNCIFSDKDSEDFQRLASFSRASINAELGFKGEEFSSGWVRDFWKQIYNLEECELWATDEQ